MASPGEESKEHAQGPSPSPRTMKRTLSLNCDHGAAIPKCVCAPATHAGSFKCRLHRVNSQSPRSPPATTITQPPAVSSTSTWTVEAL